MIQQANPFLNFNGDAKQAVALYESALGATVVASMPWDPNMFEGGKVPDNMADGVMYAMLKLGAAQIELSDVPPGMTVTPGSNTTVNLHIDDAAELDRMFAGLAAGGQVQMPPENMFWGARYGKLTDKFGINWSLHCQLEDPTQQG